MAQQEEPLLTPEVKALIGKTSEVVEMYGEVDKESIRRHCVGIPDQDPLHWDEALAKPRYGGVTTPILMVLSVARRSPPWEKDRMDAVVERDWFHDSGGGMGRAEQDLPPVSPIAGTHSHLNVGSEIEIHRYPKLGDKIFYQTRYADMRETVGQRGDRILYVTREIRYWNQDNETICIVRATGGERR